eukprot:TRINITY_DN10556_c0_g1_i2.p1 TRINITY_DN10556_c0_g1~~TRINITY_DN10556_c0_g1_i2.p1  ORF type:complete len:117 (-),score=10.66 TRINITY_DN10556_c0_g1_i2:39-389(-)
MSASEFKGQNFQRYSPPLLRKIVTDKVKTYDDSICPYLETLNLVDKAPAAVITHCQIFGIPGEMYLSLEEPRGLEVETLVAFEPCLKRFLSSPPAKVSYSRLLNSLKPKKHIQLYL